PNAGMKGRPLRSDQFLFFGKPRAQLRPKTSQQFAPRCSIANAVIRRMSAIGATASISGFWREPVCPLLTRSGHPARPARNGFGATFWLANLFTFYLPQIYTF